MRATRLVILLVAVVVIWPATSWGAAFTPGAGITGTPHDFSGKAAGTGITTGLCTFCHTPHKAQTTLLLWNHTLSTNTFKWDVPSTTAGTSFPNILGNKYNGPTVKCLSCHDGSVAIGDIAWFAEASWNGVGALDPTKIPSGDTHSVGFGGDMKGNHPVAMPYPYQQAKNTYNGSTTGNLYISTEWVLDPSAASNIRLFNDDGAGSITAGAIATKTGIECSSCHDPHNKQAVDDMFLRAKLGGTTGYICTQCHIK